MSAALDRLRTPAAGKSQAVDTHPDYEKLPEAIKLSVTPREFAWMTDGQRANLIGECVEPEVEG